MKFYAGIGSRTTPPEILVQCTRIACELEKLGFTLRSGGAEGADKAFAAGVKDPYNKVILRPKDSTREAEDLAETIHPAWHQCNSYARQLHGRNCQIILGERLDQPSEFVLAYTLDEEQGGTSLGIRLARLRGIPVFNLADSQAAGVLQEFLSAPAEPMPECSRNDSCEPGHYCSTCGAHLFTNGTSPDPLGGPCSTCLKEQT